MDAQKSKESITVTSKAAVTIMQTAATANTNRSHVRIVQNYLLIWLDANINESNKDSQNTLAELRTVVNHVNIFTEQDKCIDFLTDVDDIKILLIVEGTIGQQIVPIIDDIPQLDSIYIFCDNKSHHEQWVRQWKKIKGVHTSILSICEALQMAVKECDQNSTPVSFIMVNEEPSRQDLNQLEPAFMYTQIFKDILLEMKYSHQSIKDLANYCRQFYDGNMRELNIINQFEREYYAELAIWWYTRECFMYQMLNRALRTLEGDTIINMGPFIHDLHQQIEQLYKKQVSGYKGKLFTVYRGQGLSTEDFEKLCKTKGGLMSFNNFLSTSTKREVSLRFTKAALTRTDAIGILFQMSIDPSVSSAAFAAIQEFSYFKTEEEILFSMHTVFRIGKIIQIDTNNPLYQVDLQLTSDDDQQLRALTKHIQEEAHGLGWHRIGNLLIRIEQLVKAEELYKLLLEQTSNESDRALYYNQLGYIKTSQCDYEKAIWYLQKGLEINQKILPANHHELATLYNNIGLVYDNKGEYSRALSFYERALEICQKALPANHHHLGSCYNNIGTVYKNTGEYSKALSIYEKAFEIYQKTLPENHPSLANSYNNIGFLYDNKGEYSKALSFYEKALEICRKTLPPNHPHLGSCYNNIGLVYDHMEEYPKALSFYEKALKIYQKTLPVYHPLLATSYNNIGLVYDSMGEYSKALSFCEKALEICQKTLPLNHPLLANSYNNIAWMYRNMGNYSKALSLYERSLDILQYSLPTKHPYLEGVRESIEFVKTNAIAK